MTVERSLNAHLSRQASIITLALWTQPVNRLFSRSELALNTRRWIAVQKLTGSFSHPSRARTPRGRTTCCFRQWFSLLQRREHTCWKNVFLRRRSKHLFATNFSCERAMPRRLTVKSPIDTSSRPDSDRELSFKNSRSRDRKIEFAEERELREGVHFHEAREPADRGTARWKFMFSGSFFSCRLSATRRERGGHFRHASDRVSSRDGSRRRLRKHPRRDRSVDRRRSVPCRWAATTACTPGYRAFSWAWGDKLKREN